MKFKKKKRTREFSGLVELSVTPGEPGVYLQPEDGWVATGRLRVKLIELPRKNQARLVVSLVDPNQGDKILVQVEPVILTPGDTLSVDGFECTMSTSTPIV